jgi:hypothetical protein
VCVCVVVFMQILLVFDGFSVFFPLKSRAIILLNVSYCMSQWSNALCGRVWLVILNMIIIYRSQMLLALQSLSALLGTNRNVLGIEGLSMSRDQMC